MPDAIFTAFLAPDAIFTAFLVPGAIFRPALKIASGAKNAVKCRKNGAKNAVKIASGTKKYSKNCVWH